MNVVRLRLPWVAFIAAIVNWVAIAAAWTTLQDISKPTTIVILIVWFLIETRDQPWVWKSPRALFTAGLIFSLAGDVLLIGSGSGYFDAGLALFLTAHICYIIGFNRPWVPPGNFTALCAVLLATYAIVLYHGMYRDLHGVLKVAVAFYAIALCTMVLSSLETWRRPDWTGVGALLSSVGGLIFLSSDSLLALNRCGWPEKNLELVTMVTYYLGQFGIISGVVNRHYRRSAPNA